MHASPEFERDGAGGGLGRPYVVAAPSGAGKTGLVKALVEREPRLLFRVLYHAQAAGQRDQRARSTDSEAVIQRRLQDARRDIAHWTEFDFVVINDRFEQAVLDLQAIVQERGEARRANRRRRAWRPTCWLRSLSVRRDCGPGGCCGLASQLACRYWYWYWRGC